MARGDFVGAGQSLRGRKDFSAAAIILDKAPANAGAGRRVRAMQVISLVAAGRIDAVRDALPATTGISDHSATVAAHAARSSLLNAEGHHDDTRVAYQRALDELDAAQVQPAVRDQLRENRYAARTRIWKAQAELAAGRATVREVGLAALGAQHPFMQRLAQVDVESARTSARRERWLRRTKHASSQRGQA